jgi:tetratricopeptide (TPR) repeat protein
MLERNPDVLAYHCTEAGIFGKAIDYWLKSTRKSLGRSAGIEAQAQLEKAVKLLPSIANHAARQQFEALIQVELGNTFVMTKGFASPDVATALTKARGLLDEDAHPIEALRVLGGLCNYHLIRSEAPKLLQLAQPFLRRRIDPHCAMIGNYEVGTAYLHIGGFEDAERHLEKGFSLYDEESCHPVAFMAGTHVRSFSLVWLSLTYLYLGKLKLAMETIEAAVSDARSRHHPFTLVSALLASARLFNHTRNLPAAIAATDEGHYRTVFPRRTTSHDPAPLRVKQVWRDDRRYIVWVNPDEAEQDRHDRAAIGMEKQSLPLLAQAAALAPDTPQVLALVAVGYEALHRREEALRWLARARASGYPSELIVRNPQLAALRADPRYVATAGGAR